MYVLSLPALRAPPLAKEVVGVANEDENAKKATKRRRLNNIWGMSWISSTSLSARAREDICYIFTPYLNVKKIISYLDP